MRRQRESIIHKQKKSENFGNLLNLHCTNECSDLFLDVYNQKSDCFSHCGDFQFSIETHRFMLISASNYFRKRLGPSHLNQELGSRENKQTLSLYLNFSLGLEESVVRLFFSLFYVNRFDADHLNIRIPNQEATLLELIKSNILVLYQLAIFFYFDALTAYCEAELFGSMTLEYFTALTTFCLIKNEYTGRYAIIDERVKIYARLIEWYVCCIEHTPYTELLNTTSRGQKCNRRYFSCNKEELLNELLTSVDNIQACRIPTKSHTNFDNFTRTHIEYYRKICNACLNDNKTSYAYQGFYYINFGTLKKYYRNGHEQHFFRLKKRRTLFGPDQNVLEMSMKRIYYQEAIHVRKKQRRASLPGLEMLVDSNADAEGANIEVEEEDDPSYANTGNSTTEEEEEEEEENEEEEIQEEEEHDILISSKLNLEEMAKDLTCLYECKSQISLLSRKVKKDLTSCEYMMKDFSMPSEISDFEVHEPKHCYEAKCDTCCQKAPVYIIQLALQLSRAVELPHM
jgi:hypothetical protein